MADLVLRSVTALAPTGFTYTTKGAALTYAEIDNNFIELDTEIHNIELKLPVVSATQPAGVDGKIWYDTTTDETFIYDGTTGTWETVGSRPTVAAGAPPGITGNEVSGDQYYDTLNDDMYIFDGTTWQVTSGTKVIDGLNDVIDIASLDGQILEYDPTAVDADGRVGQWVATYIIDGSPDGGATDDF